MKYSLVSDLHLDFGGWNWKQDHLEDIVVVAGDIMNGLGGLKMLEKIRRAGHTVVACDGNHEHYSNDSQSRDIEKTRERFQKAFPNKVYHGLNEDVVFLSTNGWYYVDHPTLWLNYMNDGKYCDSAVFVNRAAGDDFNWLEDELVKCWRAGIKAIVTTHTAPGPETLDPRHDGHYSNQWYYNPSMSILRHKYSDVILAWNHGHTHAPADKIVDGVRTVCNPRGYQRYGENPDWKPLTVEIH